MIQRNVRQRQWLLVALIALTVFGALLLLSSDVSSDALTHPQDQSVIEPLGHFGGTIGSLALPSDGRDYVYAGEGTGFTVVDVSDKGQPRRVSSLPLPGSDVSDSVISGTLALLTNGDGLHTVDLSDPISPTLLGSLASPGYAYAVAVDNSHAYVAADDAGLWVVDVSDPTDPQEAASYDTTGSARSVDVVGNVAYVADQNALLTVDVADPTNPTPLGTFNAPLIQDVQVTGNTAYLARGLFGLETVDVTDPANPAPLGSDTTDGFARRVQVIGTKAYVAPRESGLHVFDVSDPANPGLLGTTDAAWEANVAAVSDQAVAYIASREKGMRVVDVSNPGNPDVLGAYERPSAVMDIATDHAYGYIAGLDRLWVLDMADPALPAPIATSGLQGAPGEPRRLSFGSHPQTGDSLIYVADWSYGVEIFDVADPSTPTLLGHYPAPTDHEVKDVFALSPHAYVLTADGGDGWLRIVDVSDPTSPNELEAYDTRGDARRVFVTDTVAYLADGTAGLRVIDVSNPANPVELDHADPPTSTATTDAVFVTGNHAYVGGSAGEAPDTRGWFQILDVSNPSVLTATDTITVDGAINDIEVRGQDAFLAVDGDGVWWLDVAEAQINFLARHETLNAQDIAVSEDGGPQLRPLQDRQPSIAAGKRTNGVVILKPKPGEVVVWLDKHGRLQIRLGGGANVEVGFDIYGNVLVNGQTVGDPPVKAYEVKGIRVWGGNGDNKIDLRGVVRDVFSGIGEDEVIMRGGAGNDEMFGSEFGDIMYGGDDDDYQDGGKGDDRQHGGKGKDTQHGGEGKDYQVGDAGDDYQNGGEGDDYQNGGKGNDTQDGGDGVDTQLGGDGDDIQNGGKGNDWQYGGDDDDTQNGGEGEDTQKGNDGIDWQSGGPGSDTQYGGDDDDTQHGGGGRDWQYPGPGNDQTYGGTGDDAHVVYFGSADAVNDEAGNDAIDASEVASAITLDLDLQGADQVVDAAGNTLRLEGQFENYLGTSFDEVVYVDPLSVRRSVAGGAHETGDTLNFDSRGAWVADDGGTINAAGYKPVTYAGFETVAGTRLCPDLASGQSWTHTFATEGSYPYYDAHSPGLTGTVVVNPTSMRGQRRRADARGSFHPSSAARTVTEVSITDAGFDPPTVTIGVSDTVHWINNSAAPHAIAGTVWCTVLEEVDIAGPIEGYIDTLYTFTSVLTPSNVTEPMTHTWSPPPDIGQGTISASYAWATPGGYTITLTAENCSGVVSGTHAITISAKTQYRIYLPLVLRTG
jgi:plastocyanin